MPLINGQKMACAPCIRGHRSTKCNHSADRVMVPVRKPGRPLSSCACPPGQSCACGGIKVAIPRKQKCKCGSDNPNGDHANHEGHDLVKPEMPTPAPTPSELPVSPTRNGVFRVQKPAPNPNPRQNGRKQSLDPYNFDRINPNSVNIVNSYNTNNGEHAIQQNAVSAINMPHHMPMALVPTLQTTGYQQPGLISYAPPLGYALVPIHSHVNSPPLHMVQRPPENGYYASQNGNSAPATNGAVRSCCASAPASVPQPQPQPQAQQPQPRKPQKKSCCGGGSADNETPARPPVTAQDPATAFNGAFDLRDQQPRQQQNQQQEPFAVSYPNNSTVFTYPANLGTWNQPLNPAMWAQLQQQTPQPQAQPQTNGHAYQDSSLPPTPNGGTQSLGTSHECSCGPGCQCVGCLAHPFNSQTLQYVGAAWDYDDEAPSYGSNHGSAQAKQSPGILSPSVRDGTFAPTAPSNSVVFSGHDRTNDATANGHIINGNDRGSAAPQQQAPQQAQPQAQPPNPDAVAGLDSPGGTTTQAQTPSDASGAFNEELPASDFMFFTLPLYQYQHGGGGQNAADGEDSCGGSLAFCPCGDDCQCVGCTIHNATPLMEGVGVGVDFDQQ